MSRLVISDAAHNDLREINIYVAHDNPLRAIPFLDELLERIVAISLKPENFPIRVDWPVEVRAAVHRRSLIIFQCDRLHVEILRVLHSVSDIDALLEGGDQ